MTLTTGTKLNHYEIVSQLGKGGMGEVYQAKDQKLGRDVAIKVLPEEFAKDANRVARFQREAKLLASLNHPNIAAIYGLEESEGTHFLVLELIEGDTLADRLKRGAIPVEESLKLALQIAEALEAAHEKGVIHRDLKPANIKVTPDGKVKVLDFGLAKAFAGEQADLNLSNSPTLSVAATQQGIILGTAAYMSPEQARGENVDKGADIWAFGAVLFEMLTGRQVFTGKTVSDTLASVLAREPEWNGLPPNLHSRIRLLLERCLKKESKNRYHDIADARVDIQEVLANPSGVFVQSVEVVKPQKKLRIILPWAAITLILIIIAGFAGWILKPISLPDTQQITRFYYEMPKNYEFSDSAQPNLAISPDGSQFAYSTSEGIFLRSMSEIHAKLVAGTAEKTVQPFFSPDGKWIGYWSMDDGQLKKIKISGGTPIPICDVSSIGYLDWGLNDTILFAGAEGIMRVSANGGIPETLIKANEESFFTPRLLPDGKSVIFTLGADEGYQVAVQSIESGKRKFLLAGSDAHYISTGHLIYVVGNDLYAIPFDLNKLEPTSGGVPLVEGIFRGGAPIFSISNSGTLVYLSGSAAGLYRNLVWVDHQGNEEQLAAPPRIYQSPRISPKGTQVAVGINDAGNDDIWIWDIARETSTRLTRDNLFEGHPLWTLDGKSVVFSRESAATSGIYQISSDGTGIIEHLHSQKGRQIFSKSWSSDGKNLLFSIITSASPIADIEMLSMEDLSRRPLLNEDYAEENPQISPDGEWLAYSSNESGQFEIYVRSFPELDKVKKKISTNGGDAPLWSPDGRELYYRNGEYVLAVEMETKPEIKPGKPKELFRGDYYYSFDVAPRQYDIHPDGKRFLMMKEVETAGGEYEAQTSRKINIVLNWFEELKERVPVD